jgi:opacity protein-like surface antigen
MQHAFTIATILALSVWAADGQVTPFASLGYNFPTGRIFVDNSIDSSFSGAVSNLDDHYLNYGRGFDLSAGVFVRMMDSVDARLSFDATFGAPPVEVEQRLQINPTNSQTNHYSYKHSLVSLKAAATPRFRVVELLDVYMGVGMGLYLSLSSFEHTSSNTVGSVTSSFNETVTFNASPRLGFFGLVGAEYPLSERVVIIGELDFETLSAKRTSQKVKADNGFPDPKRPATYVKDSPDNAPPLYIPASNWGLHIGVKVPL